MEARKAAAARGAIPVPTTPAVAPAQQVVSLTERRLVDQAQLPEDWRPIPSVAPYDQLLTAGSSVSGQQR